MYVLEATVEIDEVARLIKGYRHDFQFASYTDSDARMTNELHGWTLEDGRHVVLDSLEMTCALKRARSRES
jgi:hypothetical protein